MDVTERLQAWRAGDQTAFDAMVPEVYAAMRRIAGDLMRRQSPAHTLQPTALANEAWVKLAGSNVECENQAHFMAVAARAMRQILVDHARARASDKRHGGKRVSMTLADGNQFPVDDNILGLEDGICALEATQPRVARVTELHYFGGMTYDEIGTVVGISKATVDRDLRFARVWLADHVESP